MEGEVTRHVRARPWSPTVTELEALAGRYESADLGTTFDVLAAGEGVRVRLNGGDRVVALSPVARDVFQVARMTFRFLRGEDGRVTGLEYTNPVLRNVQFNRRTRSP